MSQRKTMPEAEVALRLAEYLVGRITGVPGASVSIDGAAAKQFDIGRYLRKRGWRQQEQRGKNKWAGCYESKGKRLEIHSRPGEGDVVVPVDSYRFIAECKKGPRKKSANGQERRLLAEVIGQATKRPAQPTDSVVVAVPRTDEFRRVAQDWLRSPLFQRTGLAIVLVGDNDSAQLLHAETAKAHAPIPSILSNAFSGEL